MLAAIVASAALAGLYARGGAGWVLGFVLLVPWLHALSARTTLGATLLCAWLMTLAYSAAVFAWFGIAIGNYTGLGAGTGLAVLLLGAPLFQPQLIAFALARHVFGRRHGMRVGALAGACAWVATEWLVPKLLGDTLGHGLYPSLLLRQWAAVGGAGGLTFLLLLANEALAAGLAAALTQRTASRYAMAKALALAALVPLLLALYGLATVATTPPGGKRLRMGLIQSNLVDYERQRQQLGAYQVVRKVLDTHFAMSYDAVVRQHVDAVLWSETSYPTTFGHPKSAAGAELDQSILDIIHSAGVPFVFGTYDRDAAGEYNAAAFVAPGTGLIGMYRKTRLFPLTEYVPGWLDSALLRRWLPWTGNWLPGNGARVFPLRLADGREMTVLPLICRDDVDTDLAIAGRRLGAQVILTMSNDAWFTDYPQGARLHQAVAAFRSIETGLSQFRVTSNGYSGVIDQYGTVLAASRMGEQTLVVGALAVSTPPPTLMVLWGNWVGLAGLAFLLLLTSMAAMTALLASPLWAKVSGPTPAQQSVVWPLRVFVLPPAARLGAGLLRSIARASLPLLALVLWQNDALRTNTLAQIRLFTLLFVIPEAACWFVLLAFRARAGIENGALVLTQGTRRIDIALTDMVALEPWRWPLPCPGATLRLAGGASWRYGLALANPAALAQALAATAGMPAQVQDQVPAPTWATRYAQAYTQAYTQARMAIRRTRLNHPLARFGLLPLALALPAYYLHQHIAYGSGVGEYTSFGLKAYASGLALWWAAWTIGVTLCAALLRTLIELGTLLTLLLRPAQAISLRQWLERFANVLLYLGLPGWLMLRIYGA